MAASSILCSGCGRDITETPQERRGLGGGSSNIVDGVVKCWRQLVERELSSKAVAAEVGGLSSPPKNGIGGAEPLL